MNIYKILETLQKFSGEPEQKPGDQVRGTEKAVSKNNEHPFKGRLVGASESVEMECDQPMTLADKLRARWEQTKQEKGLQEYGMTTGGTAMSSGPTDASTANADPVAKAKEVAKTQQKVNTLKSAGVPFTSVNQAVTAVTKDPSEPTTPQDRQVAGGLGKEVEQLISKGDPSTVNQLAALIRKTKQGGAE